MIKYLIYILIIPVFASGQFYKYATIYAGASFNSSMNELPFYEYKDNQLVEYNQDHGTNYRYAIGIKKISRYKFENKPKFYYDGTEKNATIHRSPIGNYEYLAQYERIKDRGVEFENYNLWIRRVGKSTIIKTQLNNNGYIDLQYKSLEMRFKHDLSDFRLSVGILYRNHPVYGLNAFKMDYPNYNDIQQTTADMGYSTDNGYIDANYNGYMDRWEQAYTIWTDENGDTIANSQQQFNNHYAEMVADYNKNAIDNLGNQNTLSSVIGLSYYKQKDNFFVLLYGNYVFHNLKLTEYSSTTNDYDFGIIANYKLTRTLSIYSQIEYLNYFMRENYSMNLGINLIII